MYVDDLVYNVRRLNFGFDQKINTNGSAAAIPLGGLFNIEVESPSNTHLYAWGASKYDMKYVKLVFSPVTLASSSRTIELYDTLCIGHHDYFHSEGKDPLVSVLKLSPAIIVQDGQTLVEKNWKVTDLSRQDTEASTVPAASEEEISDIVEMYYTDLNGVRISSLAEKKVKLVIETTNMIGDLIDIDFNNDFFDFKYKGQILEGDILRNYQVNSNRDEIELEVLEEIE
jgi:hypothetical protein